MKLDLYGHPTNRDAVRSRLNNGDTLEFIAFDDISVTPAFDSQEVQAAEQSGMVTYLFHPDHGGYSADLIRRHQDGIKRHLLTGTAQIKRVIAPEDEPVSVTISSCNTELGTETIDNLPATAVITAEIRNALVSLKQLNRIQTVGTKLTY